MFRNKLYNVKRTLIVDVFEEYDSIVWHYVNHVTLLLLRKRTMMLIGSCKVEPRHSTKI